MGILDDKTAIVTGGGRGVGRAALVPHGTLLEISEDVVDAAWQAGPIATMRLMRRCHPYLRGGGVIVNVSSGVTLAATAPNRAAYAMVKSALNALTRNKTSAAPSCSSWDRAPPTSPARRCPSTVASPTSAERKWQSPLSDLSTKTNRSGMDQPRETDAGQEALWNGPAGRAWVATQDVLDQLLAPLQDVLVESLPAGQSGRVLDVGCGTGSTTLAIAERLGADGDCTGIDISDPMLAAARSRADHDGIRATFVRADAQRHQFEPASFDMIVSRFGVMFFDDFVEAFANLRTAATEGAALRFIAWRRPEENPFMTTAERAAAPLVDIPARDPSAPGPFALADETRVRSVLEQSGWDSIDIHAIDVACSLPEKDLQRYVTRIGPLGRVLADADASTQARVAEVVRSAFDPFVDGSEVRFVAAIWMVGALSAGREAVQPR